MTLPEVQPRHALIVATEAPAPALEGWTQRAGADFLPVFARTIEYSDDPRSRLGREAALAHALLRGGDWCAGAEDGLLVCEARGLSDDLQRWLRNAWERAGTPVDIVSLGPDPAAWPEPRPRLHPSIDMTGAGRDGRELHFVGDVHGCAEELLALLDRLGWRRDAWGHWSRPGLPPALLAFAGDLVDRGPEAPAVLRTVGELFASAAAVGVLGNHDLHLLRFLRGEKAPRTHGMGETQDAVLGLPPSERRDILALLEGLPPQLVLDGGDVVLAHAGCPDRCAGIRSPRADKECVFGTMLGRAEDGTPERDDWAARRSGAFDVVQGHVPASGVHPRRGVWNIDTGCVFGNALTALVWRGRDIAPEAVSVPALRDHTRGHPTALRLAAERGEPADGQDDTPSLPAP